MLSRFFAVLIVFFSIGLAWEPLLTISNEKLTQFGKEMTGFNEDDYFIVLGNSSASVYQNNFEQQQLISTHDYSLVSEETSFCTISNSYGFWIRANAQTNTHTIDIFDIKQKLLNSVNIIFEPHIMKAVDFNKKTYVVIGSQETNSLLLYSYSTSDGLILLQTIPSPNASADSTFPSSFDFTSNSNELILIAADSFYQSFYYFRIDTSIAIIETSSFRLQNSVQNFGFSLSISVFSQLIVVGCDGSLLFVSFLTEKEKTTFNHFHTETNNESLFGHFVSVDEKYISASIPSLQCAFVYVYENNEVKEAKKTGDLCVNREIVENKFFGSSLSLSYPLLFGGQPYDGNGSVLVLELNKTASWIKRTIFIGSLSIIISTATFILNVLYVKHQQTKYAIHSTGEKRPFLSVNYRSAQYYTISDKEQDDSQNEQYYKADHIQASPITELLSPPIEEL